MSTPALAIIEKLREEQGGAYLFPGGKRDKPLSNMAMLALLDRMGRSDLTAHGFRSTFRDWAAECTNYPNEVVEMALAHTINSKVEAAYRRGDLFEKRKLLMSDWAEFCLSNKVRIKHHPHPRMKLPITCVVTAGVCAALAYVKGRLTT